MIISSGPGRPPGGEAVPSGSQRRDDQTPVAGDGEEPCGPRPRERLFNGDLEMRAADFRREVHGDREIFGAKSLERPTGDGAPEPVRFGGVRGADEEARASWTGRRNGIGTGHRNRLSVRSATDRQTIETVGGFRPPGDGGCDSASAVDAARRSLLVGRNVTCRVAALPVVIAN